MSKVLFIQYPKCGTCQKAAKWLKANNIDCDVRSITEENPTKEELAEWVEESGLPIKKFFNTSGKLYKERNLKDVVQTADQDELLSILASDGMLVKRPIIVAGNNILVGFNEEAWSDVLKK